MIDAANLDPLVALIDRQDPVLRRIHTRGLGGAASRSHRPLQTHDSAVTTGRGGPKLGETRNRSSGHNPIKPILLANRQPARSHSLYRHRTAAGGVPAHRRQLRRHPQLPQATASMSFNPATYAAVHHRLATQQRRILPRSRTAWTAWPVICTLPGVAVYPQAATSS